MADEINENGVVVDEDGWEINPANFENYDEGGVESANEGEGADQTELEEDSSDAEEAETPKETAEEEPASEENEKPSTFTLKYMDEEKSVGLEEMTTLAQKGMDYDRVRSERDAAKKGFKTYEAFLKELAASNNSTIEELINNSRARMKMSAAKKNGSNMTEMEAMNMVLRESREKGETFSFDELSEKKSTPNNQNSAEADKEKRQNDFKDFVKAYPDVDAKNIPKSVWDDYKNGKGSLVSLYAQTENKSLRERIAALEQNQKNAERSTGSRKTAGKPTGKSMIQELWDADDS